MNPVYSHINDRLLADLQWGIVPWRQPLPTVPARNVVFGQPYDGINAVVLNTAGHTSPWWLTFRQAHGMGGRLHQDAEPIPAVHWKTGSNGRGAAIRYAKVYNLGQCEGIEAPKIANDVRPHPMSRAGDIMAKGKLCPVYQRGDNARYMAGADQIWMPPHTAFASPETYCHEVFRQLARATGHPNRLNRDQSPGARLREGMVVDMAASFLSNEAGTLAGVSFTDTDARIGEWLTAMRQDPTVFVSAATDAQRAADLTLNRLTLSTRRTPQSTTHRQTP